MLQEQQKERQTETDTERDTETDTERGRTKRLFDLVLYCTINTEYLLYDELEEIPG
jgi:hypothetical protein